MPYYQGPLAAARSLGRLVQSARRWVRQEQYFALRGPGFLSIVVWFWLQHYRKPYVVEVLGDYREVTRVMKHPLRRLFRVGFSVLVPKIIHNASAVLYVSRALQKDYPARAGALSIEASDVQLDAGWFRPPRTYTQVPNPLRILHVGNIEQVYKGHEYLLQALAICRSRGLNVRADFVGDGRLKAQYEKQAASLGITDIVRFHGTVPWGPDVGSIIDHSDLFVFPSLTEGLGKALLEAMARGLPAIGTEVGGIPELLGPEALVPSADAEALARRITGIGTNPSKLTLLSRDNWTRAMDYRLEVLEPRRLAFYQAARRLLGN
jgi:glycosyltransferase involved in cell wall biosynthesis